MTSVAEALDAARLQGHATVRLDHEHADELLRLLRRIGSITTSQLSVKAVDMARPKTLSASHGTGAFPHHTDFAFRPIPPRFIILHNPSNRSFDRKTLVASICGLPLEVSLALERSVWTLKTRGRTFQVSGRIPLGKYSAIRWDLDSLQPANSAAAECAAAIPAILTEREVWHQWNANTALIVDNWKCTHARAGSDLTDSDRLLTRYEVWLNAGMDV